jgi:hypothetical protein
MAFRETPMNPFGQEKTEAKDAPAGHAKPGKAEAHGKPHAEPVEDHKAAVAKMHPEHVHKLVKMAHEGKFGQQAQQVAQQAMQPGGNDGQQGQAPSEAQAQKPPMGSSIFSGDGDDQQQPAGPVTGASIFS